MVRTKHEITQSRTAFPPSPGQVEWTFLDLCCITHSRRFSTLIPNTQLSRCEAAAGWCCVGPCIWVQWDVMLYSTPQPAQCPLSAPLSWSPPGSGSDAVQRLFTSSDPRLRRQWLAVTPIMLLTQPPAQNHIRLMTRGGWQSDVSPLLSQLPGRCIPSHPNWSKWSDLSLSPPTLLFVYTRLFETRAPKKKSNDVEFSSEDPILSMTHQDMFIKILPLDSERFTKEWNWEMTDIFFANLHQRDVRYLLFTTQQFILQVVLKFMTE